MYSLSSVACRKPTLSFTPTSISSNKGKKKARNKFTFIAYKYVENVIKLKENFLNNVFQYFSNFFNLFLGYCQFHLRMFPKHLKIDLFLLMYEIFLER